MGLQLPEGSRFAKLTPDDALPQGCVRAFDDLIGKIAAQARRKTILEHFKSFFAGAVGSAYFPSSDEGWAHTDLMGSMGHAACNPALFIAAFYDGCEELREGDEYELPDAELMNEILREHGVLFEIRPPRLIRVRSAARVTPPPALPSLAESAAEIIQQSLRRAEDLLAQSRPREAVQEMLWILESIATTFRGVSLPNKTVEGRYFNEIVKELRAGSQGTTLARVLDWSTQLHGYLSSPTGGGVRHGLDLNSGKPISSEEGRLFCNLILSYVTFLLSEHSRLTQ
jgi:hypothetical protein